MSNNITDNPKELNADFKELEKTLLAVKDALKGLGSETKESGLEKLSKNAKAVAGGFTAAAESLKFFGLESDGLKEIEKKVKNITEVVGGLQLAFKTLGKAGGWITVIVSAIAGLVSWYKEWREEQEKQIKQQEGLKEIEIETVKSMAEQKTKVESLISVANDYSKSLDIRSKAVKQLNTLMPDFNGYIDKEGRLIANTDVALKKYLDTLYKVEKAKKIQGYISKGKSELEELEIKGPESINWKESLISDFVGFFNKNKGQKMREDFVSVKLVEWKGGKRAKQTGINELEGIFQNLINDKSVYNALFGNENNNGGKSNKNEDLKNYKNEILKIEDDIQRAKTSLKEEGIEKEVQLIQDEYDRKIAEINKQEQKLAAILSKYGLSIPNEDKEKFQEQRDLAEKQKNKDTKTAKDNQLKKEEEELKTLLAKYQDYADQRKAIEEKFTKDIDALKKERDKAEKEGNAEKVKLYNGKIAFAEQNKGKELLTHDFNALKENPDFTWAFDNIKSTSTDTLNVLLEQLNAIKDSNKDIDATKLKEYSGAVQQIVDELVNRNPVAALANAQDRLTKANTRLAKAKQEVEKAKASEDDEVKAKAAAEHAAALIEVDKANKDVTKSQKVVNEKMGELFKNLSGVGEAIGGQAGQIISLIGDIGTFVTTSISGIEKAGQAGAGALAAVEKASAILAIIQLAIQLMSKISSIMADTHQQYEKYAKKLAEINKLRDAVNEYELAVLKAKQAEDNWFGGDDLQSLKDAKVVNSKVKDIYDAKVEEKQAKYEDKKGGGWLTNTGKWLGDAYQNTFGKIYDVTVGKPSEFLLGKTGKFIAKTGEAGSFGLGTQATLGKYKENEVSAIDNLRIETRKAKKGFLGSGIGGKSQKTEDLRTWARNNGFGELFDEDNMINKDAAQAIIDAKGDKLVGETKETLESLIKLKDQYDEYQQQLRDYVSSLYEPLVGNFVDSLWAWFDEGKDALTSFKEMASGTFRDIVSDMMKTIVLEKVVGSYSDDIVDMYNEYADGKLSEEQLMDKVAQRTDEMIDTYEEQIPALQNLMTTLGNSLNEAGIDIQKKQEEKEQTAEKGSFQTMSQETGSELLGQFTAIRIHTSNIYGLIDGMEKEGKLINNSLTAIEKNTYNTVDELKQVNNQLKQLKVEGIKVL